MASRVCWNCDTKAHMTFVSNSMVSHDLDDAMLVAGMFTCDECGHPSMGIGSARRGYSAVPDLLEGPGTRWEPAHGAARDFPDVPDHIADAATEAVRCHSINAFRASILLARSVIEATAKEKGITSGRLVT